MVHLAHELGLQPGPFLPLSANSFYSIFIILGTAKRHREAFEMAYCGDTLVTKSTGGLCVRAPPDGALILLYTNGSVARRLIPRKS